MKEPSDFAIFTVRPYGFDQEEVCQCMATCQKERMEFFTKLQKLTERHKKLRKKYAELLTAYKALLREQEEQQTTLDPSTPLN